MKNLAAIKGCVHKCPMSDGNKPHLGGEAITASKSVYIEGIGACRKNDLLKCSSPKENSINEGSSKVYINGRSAARMGDPTQHGGEIVARGAKTVYIG